MPPFVAATEGGDDPNTPAPAPFTGVGLAHAPDVPTASCAPDVPTASCTGPGLDDTLNEAAGNAGTTGTGSPKTPAEASS